METKTEKANLAVIGPLPFAGGLVPTTLTEAIELTKIFAGSALVPSALRGSPANVMVVMMKGMELGLKPMQALSEIHVIEGKAGCSAKLKVGLVLQSPLCLYFRLVESTEKKATFTTCRKGDEPVTMSFTWEMAERAGLIHKDNYKKHPAAMLRARCESGLCDAVYPDVVQGMLTRDELDEVRERLVGSGSSAGAAAVGATVAPPPPPSTPSPRSVELEPEEPEEDFDWTAAAAAKPEAPKADEKPAEPQAPTEMTALEKMLAQIAEATEPKHLEALVPAIKALSKADQLQLKKAYGQRRDELNGGKPGAA